jgi:membrane protease YdiL (CAAX protease family)
MQPEPEEIVTEPVTLYPPARDTRALWLEVLAVILIGVLPDLWNTASQWMSQWLGSEPAEWSFFETQGYLLFRSFQVSCLVLYLMSRSGTPWSRFGIVAPRWVVDPLAAFGTLVASYFVYAIYAAGVAAVVTTEAVRQEGETIAAMFERPEGPAASMLLVAACVANGFAEELVMRGYLVPRFEELLGSSVKAVLLSSVLFASYHLYQGLYGAGSALVAGLLYGAAFCSLRRLWPLAAAHALLDISAG